MRKRSVEVRRRLSAASRMAGNTIKNGNIGISTCMTGPLKNGSKASNQGVGHPFAVRTRRGNSEMRTKIREKPVAEMRTAPASDQVSLLRSRISLEWSASPVAMPAIVARCPSPVKPPRAPRGLGRRDQELNAVAPGARLAI